MTAVGSPGLGLAEALVERVAGAAHGADGVALALAVERFAQPADVDIDGALVDVDVASPNAVEQLLARKYPAGTLQQKFQQTKLGRPQLDLAAAAKDATTVAVELDLAGAEDARNPLRLGAPQQRANARDQLRHGERLDDVIVGAGREAAHALVFFPPRREHDDRQLRGLRPRAQPAAQLDARQAGQHPVEQNEIGHALGEFQLRFVAARGSLHRVAFRLEVVAKQQRERLLVFHDQDAGSAGRAQAANLT